MRPLGPLSPKRRWPKDLLGQFKPTSLKADHPDLVLTALIMMNGCCPATLIILDIMTTGGVVEHFLDASSVLNALRVPHSILCV